MIFNLLAFLFLPNPNSKGKDISFFEGYDAPWATKARPHRMSRIWYWICLQLVAACSLEVSVSFLFLFEDLAGYLFWVQGPFLQAEDLSLSRRELLGSAVLIFPLARPGRLGPERGKDLDLFWGLRAQQLFGHRRSVCVKPNCPKAPSERLRDPWNMHDPRHYPWAGNGDSCGETELPQHLLHFHTNSQRRKAITSGNTRKCLSLFLFVNFQLV